MCKSASSLAAIFALGFVAPATAQITTSLVRTDSVNINVNAETTTGAQVNQEISQTQFVDPGGDNPSNASAIAVSTASVSNGNGNAQADGTTDVLATLSPTTGCTLDVLFQSVADCSGEATEPGSFATSWSFIGSIAGSDNGSHSWLVTEAEGQQKTVTITGYLVLTRVDLDGQAAFGGSIASDFLNVHWGDGWITGWHMRWDPGFEAYVEEWIDEPLSEGSYTINFEGQRQTGATLNMTFTSGYGVQLWPGGVFQQPFSESLNGQATVLFHQYISGQQ